MKKTEQFLEKYWVLSVIGVGILLEIFLLKAISSLVTLFLAISWILLIRHFRFESRVSFYLALFFLSFCPILLIFSKEVVAERFAIWVYNFLLIGIIQLVLEYGKKTKDRLRVQRKLK